MWWLRGLLKTPNSMFGVAADVRRIQTPKTSSMWLTNGRAITDMSDKSGIGLPHLAEIAAHWNSRQRRGVRQPYAALAACPFAGGIGKCPGKFIGSRNPPPHVGGYISCVGSFWQIGAWFSVLSETLF
jgi:hypothetical protein